MQLARKLADTVARVHNPMMRGEVVSKVSARIGVAAREFEMLLNRPQRDRASSVQQVQAAPLPAPRHDIAMLCLLALRDVDARNLLLSENWEEVLGQTPDAEMLVHILQSDVRPDDPASVNAFMSSLAPSEEALVSSWLLQRMPPNAAAVARDWWAGIQQAALRRQLQIAEGRLRIPQLSVGEMTTLQKQVVDLKTQLGELSAVSPARVFDK
jgi:hypothetical protein